ncbi:MAG: hypothetical protein ABI995_01205 [Acidobacteriota bacterium]
MPTKQPTRDSVNPEFDYHSLSLADLIKARDLYHLHLTQRKGAIATAVGLYLIRTHDSWPGDERKVKGSGPKNFETAGIRPYSWPCILVFVKKWIAEADMKEHGYGLRDLIPDRLFMPDGKVVPVCVVEAAPDLMARQEPMHPRLPKNFLGGGYPVIADVQGEQHMASIGCLVTDGHLVFALTNRHVAGKAGEVLYAPLEGERIPIGVSSKKQLGRLKFETVYPGWPGTNVFLNADIGLVEVQDKNRWTPQIYSIGTMGPLADLSMDNLSLDLLKTDREGNGRANLCGFGAASGEMYGRVWGFFYRYQSVGGFDYVSDFLIGPRTGKGRKKLETHHGDSGTLWFLEPVKGVTGDAGTYRPVAVQWGGQVFDGTTTRGRRPFALATLLSTVCRLLEVDPVRDWGFALPEYWGTVGHFTIANLACEIVGKSASKIRKLMKNNLDNITFELGDITIKGTQGLSRKQHVPLADVPDLVWKMNPKVPGGGIIVGSRGPRGKNPESPNHFADMDETPPDGTPTLLTLCDDPANVDPDVWIDYARKFPKKAGVSDQAEAMGLLPFRVWQIYDEMVGFVKAGKRDEFVCAAGTLAHYVGDACQPLHISFLHHGDPDTPVVTTVTHKTGQNAGKTEEENLSFDVHEDYEQTMFRDSQGTVHEGEDMKSQLQALLNAGGSNGTAVKGGRAAAIATVAMMKQTFTTIHPKEICDAFDAALLDGSAKSDILAMLFTKFGKRTVKVMSFGCMHLALLWESAWAEGHGDTTIGNVDASLPDDLTTLYNKHDFLESFLLTQIGAHLAGRVGGGVPPAPKKKKPKKKK